MNPTSTCANVPTDDGVTDIAEKAWNALQMRGIPPTPLNFDVFYTFYKGSNPRLTETLCRIEKNGERVTPQQIEAAHAECITGDHAVDDVEIGAGEIVDTAQGIIDQIVDGGEALRVYGDALDRCKTHMEGRISPDDLLRVIAAMSTETKEAEARNQVLKEQLTASVKRIARLRHDLVQVRQVATTDPLTGIANRRAFDVRLRRAIQQVRANPETPFSLLMLDVDHFKRFNDTHGHRTGDQVLRVVARMLSDNVKGRDTAARFGGEEFAILLADADLRPAEIVARQICERIARQRLIKRGTGESIGQITISIGVAQHRPNETGASLIERADSALYKAKQSGRNQVAV